MPYPVPGFAAVATLVLAIASSSLAGDAAAADAARGKALYETRCNACHNTSVHQSAARKAVNFGEIRAQVARWSGQLGTSWDAGDIDDISVFLNDLNYRLPCPPAACAAKIGLR